MAKRRVAALVLPHWNAWVTQHNALCFGSRAAGDFGIAAEHAVSRLPHASQLERADYAVSSNLARTVDATRQAVIDTRSWRQLAGGRRVMSASD